MERRPLNLREPLPPGRALLANRSPAAGAISAHALDISDKERMRHSARFVKDFGSNHLSEALQA